MRVLMTATALGGGVPLVDASLRNPLPCPPPIPPSPPMRSAPAASAWTWKLPPRDHQDGRHVRLLMTKFATGRALEHLAAYVASAADTNRATAAASAAPESHPEHELAQELAALNQAAGASLTLLRHIYEKHPPANPAHRLAEEPTVDNTKELLKQAVVHFHPDKAMQVRRHAPTNSLHLLPPHGAGWNGPGGLCAASPPSAGFLN